MNEIQKIAIKNSALTTLYIACVVGFMNYANSIKIEHKNQFLAPIVFLSLFVFSAAITGFLIFGKPLQLYFDGKKGEAIKLIGYTLASFGVTTVVLIVLLLTLF